MSGLVAKLVVALLATVRSFLFDPAGFFFAILFLPTLFSSCSMARRVLIPLNLSVLIDLLPALLRQKDGAVLHEVSDALTIVVALHVTAVVPGRLNVYALNYPWFRNEKRQNFVAIHGVHHVSDAVQFGFPLPVGCKLHALVAGRNILENVAVVPLIVNSMIHNLFRTKNKVLESWPGSILV